MITANRRHVNSVVVNMTILRACRCRMPVKPFAGWRFALLLLASLAAGGCVKSNDDRSGDVGPPTPNVPLRLLVVGDPSMASAIEQLKGEWAAQAGAPLTVDRKDQIDWAANSPPEADCILAASHQLAELAERSWIVPIPRKLLRQADGTDAAPADAPMRRGWSKVFPLIRAQEAVWDAKTMAVPFGSPVLSLYYRADLFDKLGVQPPKNWAEYQKLVDLLSDRKRLGPLAPAADKPWCGAIEPLASGWAGITLLARAAPYATHRSNFSTLFNIETMEPLIQGPPFVRALEELLAANRPLSPKDRGLDPDAIRLAFWAGQCGMAMTWPTDADHAIRFAGPGVRLGVAELPGGGDVYNVASKAWETRRPDEDPYVPLLGIAGRLGTVTTRCTSPEAAFRLLFWLSDAQWNRQVSAVSSATTLFQPPGTQGPSIWTERPISPAVAAKYAALVERTLSRQHCVFALRLPGRAQYLAALDEAVQKALTGKASPQTALDQAAAAWKEITKRLGLERQRDAYRHSLGL